VSHHHVAQVNIGRLRAPQGSPLVAEFFAALDPINALADAAPGFVWRLQTDSGNATDIRVDDDDLVIVNLSVWESIEALREFAYRSDHRDYLRRRREWFEVLGEAYLALWWVPVGTEPTALDAVDRLARLREHGPMPDAFTFKDAFPPPSS